MLSLIKGQMVVISKFVLHNYLSWQADQTLSTDKIKKYLFSFLAVILTNREGKLCCLLTNQCFLLDFLNQVEVGQLITFLFNVADQCIKVIWKTPGFWYY